MGFELILGYEVVDDSAVATRTAIEVTYGVGTERFLWKSPAQLVYCPSGSSLSGGPSF